MTTLEKFGRYGANRETVEKIGTTLERRMLRVLKHSIIDGMTVTEICEKVFVHNTTRSQWCEWRDQIRNSMLELTKKELCKMAEIADFDGGHFGYTTLFWK